MAVRTTLSRSPDRNRREIWQTYLRGGLEARMKPGGEEGRDGRWAEWIWNLAEQFLSGAVQIVDLYHARQHPRELARRLHPNDQLH